MKIANKMEEAINKQVNAEIYSAYLYLSMSEFFSVFDLKLSPNRHFQPCVPVSV